MRILVTNDDGIDSIGLHVLARAMRPFGDVVVAAPDEEYSGFGAALGCGDQLEVPPELLGDGGGHGQAEGVATGRIAACGDARPPVA